MISPTGIAAANAMLNPVAAEVTVRAAATHTGFSANRASNEAQVAEKLGNGKFSGDGGAKSSQARTMAKAPAIPVMMRQMLIDITLLEPPSPTSKVVS